MAAARHHNRPAFMYKTVTGYFVLMMTLMGCSPSEQAPQQVTPSAQTTTESAVSISTTSSESADAVVTPASGIEGASTSSASSETNSSTAATSTRSSSKSYMTAASSSSHIAMTSTPAEPVASSKPAGSETSNVSQSVSSSIAASSASQPTTAAEQASSHTSLDLNSLEQRLRDTKAIGVFTKLSLKNQVDDLLDDFRAYYKGKAKPQLPDLRQRYDLLLMKLLTLLQDDDPPLAADIRSSREAIWDILKDPKKFAEIS